MKTFLIVCVAVVIVGLATARSMRVCDDVSTLRHEGEEWDVGNWRCKCDLPELYFLSWAERNRMGPKKSCQLRGCSDRGDGSFRPPGARYTRSDETLCVCEEGSDPGLMDASTLYHWNCNL